MAPSCRGSRRIQGRVQTAEKKSLIEPLRNFSCRRSPNLQRHRPEDTVCHLVGTRKLLFYGVAHERCEPEQEERPKRVWVNLRTRVGSDAV